jgi:hypothetical protein
MASSVGACGVRSIGASVDEEDLGLCRCGRQLKRHANHPEVIGHVGQCEFTEPYFDGGRVINEVDFVDEADLADDLADVLTRMVVGWRDRLGVDLAEHPDVQRVMARYCRARGR